MNFSTFYTVLRVPFISSNLNPLNFLHFLTNINTFSQHLVDLMSIPLPQKFGSFHGTPPTILNNTLSNTLIIIIFYMNMIRFACIVVLDHSWSNGILQYDLFVLIAETIVVLHQFCCFHLVYLIQWFPVT